MRTTFLWTRSASLYIFWIPGFHPPSILKTYGIEKTFLRSAEGASRKEDQQTPTKSLFKTDLYFGHQKSSPLNQFATLIVSILFEGQCK